MPFFCCCCCWNDANLSVHLFVSANSLENVYECTDASCSLSPSLSFALSLYGCKCKFAANKMKWSRHNVLDSQNNTVLAPSFFFLLWFIFRKINVLFLCVLSNTKFGIYLHSLYRQNFWCRSHLLHSLKKKTRNLNWFYENVNAWFCRSLNFGRARVHSFFFSNIILALFLLNIFRSIARSFAWKMKHLKHNRI